jgi:hypothetical protein
MPDARRMLELALKGLEAERATIDDEIAQLRGQLNPRPAVPTAAPKKRTMSAAARRKISEAMKRRYAQINSGGNKANAVPQISKPQSATLKQGSVKSQNGGSGLTAAGRKKLSDLMKKRWAERRKAKAK